MLEGRANADIFSIWFAHVRLDWARIIILDAPIGHILWCVRVEKVRRHFRQAFQVRDTSLRRNTNGEMFVAFLFAVFSGTISTIWRGWPQLMASWRWWPHGPAAQYDWGNVSSISVRSFLEYSFDQLAWVAPIDCQLALVAPWPRNGPRVIN